MSEEVKPEGILNPYRVLDLTDEKGLFCGKLLADLGADVIKVERPGGDPARKVAPFCHDEIHPERSLFWWAYNTNKRGITLDIETGAGRQALIKLVESADFILESFPPGYMERLGLGYRDLEKINPAIIVVSISPFGQTGPYRDYKASDITLWALGGVMYQYGDPDRQPVRISYHSQACLHAAAEAAAAAMIALNYRNATGLGQHIDVSIHETVVRTTFLVTASWQMIGSNLRRGGSGRPGMKIILTRIWPCKDGHVMWYFFGGSVEHLDKPFIQWMNDEGAADEFMKNFDWKTLLWTSIGQETVNRLEEPIGKFFLTRTKDELMEAALKYNFVLYPINTVVDVLKSPQLAHRDFWTRLEHPEAGVACRYPGAFTKASALPPKVSRRAPLVGEHNREVLAAGAGATARTGGTAAPEKPGIRKALEGLKVLDFSWNYVGPLATKTMADHGAQVVKIESTQHPDAIRCALPPYKDNVLGLNRNGSFNELNTSKLSLTLDITHPKGKEIIRKLTAWADIVVENFAGGEMERMGFGYEELKKIKPDIIMISSCMQGQTGPHAAHRGFGYFLTALAGISQIAGYPDRVPVWYGPYTDFVTPHFLALTVMAALDFRRRTGRGLYFDMSQYETGMHFLAPLILDYEVNGRVATRMGNRSDRAVPHGAFRCAGDDRWCTIAVHTEEEWGNFCQAIGRPAWTKDPRFADLAARKLNEDELERQVEAWTVGRPAEEVMALLQGAGVEAGVVQTGEDLLVKDPQLKARRFFRELDHAETGKYLAPRASFLLSRCPTELRTTPLIGEHNEYVLKEILHIDDEEMAELVIGGVLQ